MRLKVTTYAIAKLESDNLMENKSKSEQFDSKTKIISHLRCTINIFANCILTEL